MSLVHFVIPTIGRPSLSQTCTSLQAQTDGDWTAMVMIDGIDINTNSIPVPADPRFSLGMMMTTKKSAGLTRNAAIDLSIEGGVDADWFAFVDDDDVLAPLYVEQLRETIYENDVDVVIFRMLFPDGSVLPHPTAPMIGHGSVGISFVVRRDWFVDKDFRFIKEDLDNPGVDGNEDINLLLRLRDAGAIMAISPYVGYHVKPKGE